MTDTFRKQYNLAPEHVKELNDFKIVAEALLQVINHYQPSREMSLAKTKLEECVMWGVKGISIQKDNENG